jgi:prophage regulatory protein
MTPDNDNRPRLISMQDTTKEVPFSRTMLMNMAAVGEFPQPIKLGPKRLAFLRSEVEAWIDQKIAARSAA